MKTFLLSAITIASVLAVNAQSPTIVTNSTNCVVFRNFNNSNEGFSSPSIYSGGNDVPFFWNSAIGAEISSGISSSNASLISPVYILSAPGQLTIGFKYAAPAGTKYRIRVISAVISAPIEVLANTANGSVYTPLPATSGHICLSLSDADLTAGRAVRLEFTFKANQSCENILFDDLALSVAGGPLPVTFEGFSAQKNADGTLKLLWNVGTEINVKGYYVESSINGIDFTNAGYVTASGRSIYSLVYTGKLAQTTFFRVRNIDFDGSSKYTPIIKVYSRDQMDARIQIYPVPATDLVTIQHNKSSENSVFTLLTPDGKIIKRIEATPNTLQTQININNLPTGIYLVRYDNGNGDVQSAKLIKD
ncbi:MAG: T9SS type A sorting domain-containing protein [Ferruginibacter sp.]